MLAAYVLTVSHLSISSRRSLKPIHQRKRLLFARRSLTGSWWWFLTMFEMDAAEPVSERIKSVHSPNSVQSLEVAASQLSELGRSIGSWKGDTSPLSVSVGFISKRIWLGSEKAAFSRKAIVAEKLTYKLLTFLKSI